MITGLTPDNEGFLNQAVAAGVFPDRETALNEAIRMLRSELKSASTGADREPTEQWIARLRAWSDRHPRINGFVDDSRESIY